MKKYNIIKLFLVIMAFSIMLNACASKSLVNKNSSTVSSSISDINSNSNNIQIISKEDAVNKADFILGDKKNVQATFGLIKNIRIYEPNEDIWVYYYIKNIDKNATVEITFKNKVFKVNEVKTFTIQKGKETDPILDKFKATKNGIYSLSFKVIDETGSEIFSEQKNIGIMPKAKKVAGEGFYFGVQPFLIRVIEWAGVTAFDNMDAEQTYNVTWDYIDYIGANLVRDGNVWASMQASEGDVKFTDNDRLVKDCKDRGVILDWHMGGTPAFALATKYQDSTTAWDKPPELSIWLDYLKKVGEHYKSDNKTIIYEIINEPNWEFFRGTPQEYTTILEESAKLLKNINKENIVIPGGMVMPRGDKDDAVYYAKYNELLKSKLIDMVSYHSHADFSGYMNDAKAFKNFTQTAGIDSSVAFLNESGIETDGIAQAEEVLKKALWARGNNQKGFVMFSFRGFDGGGVNASPSWGSISKINEPKELYIAYGNMIGQLDGATTIKPIYNDKYYGFLYEKENKSILVAYKESTMKDIPISIDKKTPYKAYDILGNQITDGSELIISNSPVYYVFDGKIAESDLVFGIPSFYKNYVNFDW